ncbi:MAG: substrate-binding domain-containing protein, partial [Candidatus Aminicenantes bacterium]|nr:substrate-binding domain-containing protein [Candidatus Aminicenantes bacterium]
MKKRTVAAVVLLSAGILGLPLSAALNVPQKSVSLQIKGSDTMVNLGQAWAEAFNKLHPKVNIAVTGGGSGTGIAALLNGTCDVAESSRAVEEKEIKQAEKNGVTFSQEIVALDGI